MKNLLENFAGGNQTKNLTYNYTEIYAKLPQFNNSDKKAIRTKFRKLFDAMQAKSKQLTNKDYKELNDLVKIVALDVSQFKQVLKAKYNLDIDKNLAKKATKKATKKTTPKVENKAK